MIDDFLEFPDEERARGLAKFKGFVGDTGHAFTLRHCCAAPPTVELKTAIEEALGRKIAGWCDFEADVESTNCNGAYRVDAAGASSSSATPDADANPVGWSASEAAPRAVVVSRETNGGFACGAILFLTPDAPAEGAGVVFCEHREVAARKLLAGSAVVAAAAVAAAESAAAVAAESAAAASEADALMERDRSVAPPTRADSVWRARDVVENVYNRLVVFDARLPRCVDASTLDVGQRSRRTGGGFGATLDTARLVRTFFFDLA